MPKLWRYLWFQTCQKEEKKWVYSTGSGRNSPLFDSTEKEWEKRLVSASFIVIGVPIRTCPGAVRPQKGSG